MRNKLNLGKILFANRCYLTGSLLQIRNPQRTPSYHEVYNEAPQVPNRRYSSQEIVYDDDQSFNKVNQSLY